MIGRIKIVRRVITRLDEKFEDFMALCSLCRVPEREFEVYRKSSRAVKIYSPAGLVHDLAVATLQPPTAAATPAQNTTTRAHQSDFELPEWVVNDVLEGEKKKRKI